MDESLNKVISQELAKHAWRLAEPQDEFCAAVRNELRALGSELAKAQPEQVTRSVKRCYARVLHTACGARDAKAYPRAYSELHAYLLAHARYLIPEQPEIAQDLTQQALIEILEHYGDCKHADRFLGWCKQILVNQHLARLRKQVRTHKTTKGKQYAKREISLEELTENAEGEPEPRLTARELFARLDDVTQKTLREPMLEALAQTLRECLKKERRVRVIIELFFYDKTFSQLAQELGLTALNIQVIKSRALELLRQCLAMQQWRTDWYA